MSRTPGIPGGPTLVSSNHFSADPPSTFGTWTDGERGDNPGRAMEACRQYLRMLALREMDDRLAAKGGVSDLIQETFLEAHRDIDRFRGRTTAQFRAWLRTILRH